MGIFSVGSVEELPAEFRSYGSRAVPSLVFPWEALSGGTVPLLRPDTPTHHSDGRALAKYLFPAAAQVPLLVHPCMRQRLEDTSTEVVIVEGCKQVLAVTSALREDSRYAVIGIAGCSNYLTGGKPIDDIEAVAWTGRTAHLMPDADMRTNPNVYDAMKRLKEMLRGSGAAKMLFVHLPREGTDGADDLLGAMDRSARHNAVTGWLTSATPKPGPRPTRRTAFFEGRCLLPADLAAAILAERPMALGAGDELFVYDAGVYVPDGGAVRADLVRRLGNDYDPRHEKTVAAFLEGHLRGQRRVIPRTPGRLLNVKNGLLDLESWHLAPHSPDYLSTAQLPVAWEPQATAPRYEA